MAEFVQQNIEEILPELEQSERIGLFNAEECRKILHHREALEYKLQRRTKQKADFLHYIQYEKDVLNLIKKRRSRLGITAKRKEIDIAVIQRIHKLYRLACKRFQSDISLWLSHIEFCKERKEKRSVTKNYQRMLQVHNRKPELWVDAAMYELNILQLPESAQAVMLQGLRYNPKSGLLFLKLFEIELSVAGKLRKQRAILMGLLPELEQEAPDPLLCGKVAEVVLKNALEARPDDVKFLTQFLPICQKFTFTEKIMEFIYDVLQTQHQHQPRAWDALARRHFAHCDSGRADECATHENLAFLKYAEAVQHLNTEVMWSFYIKACLETLHWDGSPEVIRQRIDRALTVCQRGADHRRLSEENFHLWLDLLSKTGQAEASLRVADLATDHHVKSAKLWLRRLQLMVQTLALPYDIDRAFQVARASVPAKECWPLWQLYLTYLAIHMDSTALEELLKVAVEEDYPVGLPAKEVYLQWGFLTGGIKHARRLFISLSRSLPNPPGLYQKYLAMELAQPTVRMKHVRKTYEQATLEHGQNEPDLWASYMRLEMQHPLGDFSRVAEIKFGATSSLRADLRANFIAKSSVLESGALKPSQNVGVWTCIPAQ